jgi:hypothetical protein
MLLLCAIILLLLYRKKEIFFSLLKRTKKEPALEQNRAEELWINTSLLWVLLLVFLGFSPQVFKMKGMIAACVCLVMLFTIETRKMNRLAVTGVIILLLLLNMAALHTYHDANGYGYANWNDIAEKAATYNGTIVMTQMSYYPFIYHYNMTAFRTNAVPKHIIVLSWPDDGTRPAAYYWDSIKKEERFMLISDVYLQEYIPLDIFDVIMEQYDSNELGEYEEHIVLSTYTRE